MSHSSQEDISQKEDRSDLSLRICRGITVGGGANSSSPYFRLIRKKGRKGVATGGGAAFAPQTGVLKLLGLIISAKKVRGVGGIFVTIVS